MKSKVFYANELDQESVEIQKFIDDNPTYYVYDVINVGPNDILVIVNLKKNDED